MLQIIYKNVYCKQVASEVSDRGLEDTMLAAFDYVSTHDGVWSAEIHNRAGFVLRIDFAYLRKPVADVCRIPISKYQLTKSSVSHQMTLAL